MKSTFIQVAIPALLSLVSVATAEDCCRFTLTAPACFSEPAGQLDDGQIRFNGSYPPTTFCLNSEGGISDENGFGCIVTEGPTAQIQCDEGKAPTPGFSVGEDNTLLYNGAEEFHACPATDTEYNIYVSPDFGQEKCFPLTFKTSGCGAAPSPSPEPSPSCPSASTVWITEWSTQTESITTTLTLTSVGSCSSADSSTMSTSGTSTWGNSSLPCARCSSSTELGETVTDTIPTIVTVTDTRPTTELGGTVADTIPTTQLGGTVTETIPTPR